MSPHRTSHVHPTHPRRTHPLSVTIPGGNGGERPGIVTLSGGWGL